MSLRPEPLVASRPLRDAVARFGVHLPIALPDKIASTDGGIWRLTDPYPAMVKMAAELSPERIRELRPRQLCGLIYETRNRLAGDPWNTEERLMADGLVADALDELPETAAFEEIRERLRSLAKES